MDYLPRPKFAVLPPIQVPLGDVEKYWFQASWSDYKAGNHWKSFPSRYGYPHGQWWDETGPWENRQWTPNFLRWLCEIGGRAKDDLRALVIAWLYFGVLSEVCQCRLYLPKYWRVSEGGKRILCMTGRDLERIENLWWKIGRDLSGSFYFRGETENLTLEVHPGLSGATATHWDVPFDKPYAQLNSQGRCLALERVCECLIRSKMILIFLAMKGYIDTETTFVIASLYETLARFADSIFDGEVTQRYADEYRLIIHNTGWMTNPEFFEYIHDAVNGLGWCPRTIHAFRLDTSRTLASAYFTINTKSPQINEDHSACSARMCLAYQLDSKNYPRVHSASETQDCSCANLLADPNVTGAILGNEGSSPLVQVSSVKDNNTAQIEILDSAPGQDYIAVSHVWSHGLGNPYENSLPACQLLRIQGFVNALGKNEPEHDPSCTAPFWMDTLCIPRQPKELRKKAIMRMATVYQKAKHVLVIDKNLCSLATSDLNALEMLTHISNSVWTTRLWTLQEARLATNLWFQFNDNSISLSNLLREAKDGAIQRRIHAGFSADPNSPNPFLYSMLVIERSVTARRDLQDSVETRPGNFQSDEIALSHQLLLIQTSLRSRSTSLASDEAICLCSLLGKDVAPVLKFDADQPEARMGAFWSQWRAIPQGIIFNDFPRLRHKGLRWAPATVLRHNKEGWLLRQRVQNSQRLGHLCDSGQGIRVNMAGLLLPSRHVWLKACFTQEATIGQKLVVAEEYMGTNTGGWYEIWLKELIHTEALDYEADQAGSFAIIVPYSSLRDLDSNVQPALIVWIREKTSDAVYATSIRHASIIRATGVDAMIYEAGYRALSTIERASRSEDLDSQEIVSLGEAIDRIGEEALQVPFVKSTFESIMGQNPGYSVAQRWRAASVDERQDFDFRRAQGDIRWFREEHVVARRYCSGVAFPEHQKWCVD